MTAGEARAHLFEGFLTLLERLAEQGPLALIIEDAHWADRSSRDLLAFLIGYQRAVPNLLIVVTFRSDELHRTHPLRPLLAELARIDWVDRTELPPLTRGQAEELAAVVLGRTPDRGLADAIFERAQGNPLFTEELLACSDGPDGCDMVPDSLADLLLQAVRRLPEDTQEVLRVASAGSGVTSDALLAQVTGLDAGKLIAAIRPAVAANVLVTTGDGYSFRHALIQEAVHADLLPGEHAAVHTRFAGAIDVDPSLVSAGRADIEKAHHWYSAHNTTGALAASWRATVQASNVVAHAERLMLLDRVLELWEQVPDAAAQIGADHVRVLEEAVAAAGDAAEPQRGLAFVELALAELDEAAEPVRYALLLRRRFTFHKDLGLAPVRGRPAPGARPGARGRLAVGPDGAADLRRALRHRQRRAAVPRLGGGRAAARARARQRRRAGGGARQPGDARGRAEPGRGQRQRGLPAADAGARAHQAGLGVPPHHQAGDHRDAPAVRRGRVRARRAGRRGAASPTPSGTASPGQAARSWRSTWRSRCCTSGAGTRRRRWPGARSTSRRRRAPGSGCGCWTASSRSPGETSPGRPGGPARPGWCSPPAATTSSITCRSPSLTSPWRWPPRGRPPPSPRPPRRCSQYDVSAASPRYAWPLLVTAATAAVQAPGEEAAALLDKLRTLAEKQDVCGPVQRAWQLSFAALDPQAVFDAVAEQDTARRRPARRRGRGRRRVGSGRPAVPGGRRARPCRPRRPGGAAQVFRRGAHEAAARLRRAAPIAQRLGAFPLAAQLAELEHRAGADGDADEPGLTARELEVLRLVAAGQSNREIAATLVISPKTASVHVSNILAKLGAATRTEAAVKAHQLLLL